MNNIYNIIFNKNIQDFLEEITSNKMHYYDEYMYKNLSDEKKWIFNWFYQNGLLQKIHKGINNQNKTAKFYVSSYAISINTVLNDLIGNRIYKKLISDYNVAPDAIVFYFTNKGFDKNQSSEELFNNLTDFFKEKNINPFNLGYNTVVNSK